MEGTEKVYCLGNDNNAAEMMALMNNNNWNNNPFMYLIWLAFFGNNGFGFNGKGCDNSIQNAELMSRLNQMQTQMSDSFNAQNTNGIIASNHDAINTGFAGVQAGISNAINSGTINAKDMQALFQNCCCENKLGTQKMGYENQISNLSQTNQLMERIGQLANGVTQGFSATAYETQKQTCDIINNNNANTQKIVDTLTTHWQNETSQALQDAKFEISQLKQNQLLINSLGGGCACA